MIEPNGIVRYRGDMQPIATKPAAAHRAAAADRCEKLLRHSELLRRRQAALRNAPKGCDLKKLQTRK